MMNGEEREIYQSGLGQGQVAGENENPYRPKDPRENWKWQTWQKGYEQGYEEWMNDD